MLEMDQRDRELLAALQGEIPLVSTPFSFVGQALDMSEKEVIKRTERLRRDGIVRQVAIQFDPRALGYHSSLVAARVPAERADDAAAIINGHPGVTQNYLRNNKELNLWFTLYVGPESRLGLERTVELLGSEAECEVTRMLPTLRLYKNGSSGEGETLEVEGDATLTPLTPLEIECVRLLQSEVPLQPRPFDALARTATVTSDEVLAVAKQMRQKGQIRRFAAMIDSRRTGFVASAMGVWSVPAERADEVGAQFAKHRAVSHCYLRPTCDEWPYNLYTTVHARSVDECESLINDLAADSGLTVKQTLFPIKEYRKARLSYFAPEADEWESSRLTPQAAVS